MFSISLAVADRTQAGGEYMNVGGPKDIFSLPALTADVISSLAVGEPCEVQAVEGDWLEIAFYKEMLGNQTGWITAEGMERMAPEGVVSCDIPVDFPTTPSYEEDFGGASVVSEKDNHGLYDPEVRAFWNSGTDQEYIETIVQNPSLSSGTYLRTIQHVDSGYSVDASITETRAGILDINVFVTFDPDYTTNDDIACFNLYLNGEKAACVNPYWDNENKILAPTTFYTSIHDQGTIHEAYLVPVHEEWGEYSHEKIYLQEAPLPQWPAATPSATRLYANAQVIPGCTAQASLVRTTGDILSANVFLTFDSNYTSNDDIASFNLYLNGQYTANVSAYWDNDNQILAATTFYTAIHFRDDVWSAYLLPVFEECGEDCNRALYLN